MTARAMAALAALWVAMADPAAASTALYTAAGGRVRVCPTGHYCTAEGKLPCAAGTFNDELGQDACKACPDGARCPQGAARPQWDSTAPPAPQETRDGRVVEPGTPPPATSTGPTSCRAGHYCPADGVARPCSAGYFGRGEAPRWTAMCDGLCPAGFICPRGTSEPEPCPAQATLFCPEGSSSPQTVRPGRYVRNHAEVMAEPGYTVDAAGVRTPCPAGTFGDTPGETRAACAGPCAAGYYCPSGSTSPTAVRCTSPASFCPAGSQEPTPVNPGHWTDEARTRQEACPVGYFCKRGLRIACPAGSYNSDDTGLGEVTDCWSCPAGHVCATDQIAECGGPDRFCPAGDPFVPLTCPDGSYTHSAAHKLRSTRSSCSFSEPSCEVHNYNALYLPLPTVLDDAARRSATSPCEPGHFCIAGERFECPPGVFGAGPGLVSAECSGTCEAGFFCPAASSTSRQFECPPGPWFCPAGSGSPHPVRPGYYVTAGRDAETRCDMGHYCIDGARFPCAAGKFGAQEGLSSPECSGFCPAGFYCPEASREARAFPCVRTDQFCPVGSKAPRAVSRGYWTNEERSWQYPCEIGRYCIDGVQRPCPAGVYGASERMDSQACSGPCKAGYFCPQESTTPTTYKCSAALGFTRDGQTFHANNMADRTCLVHLLDVYPEQFFEFSVLHKHQDRDPTLWNLAHDKRGQYTVVNTMEWDAEARAFRARGNSNHDYMRTGWRPTAGPKTMCVWKMVLGDVLMGLDGMQKQQASNDYFMLGTYWSHKDRLFVSSGTSRGGYASVPVPIRKGQWVFYCLASGGAFGSSEAYVATPETAGPVKVWEQADNGADRGIAASHPHLSMTYGRTSTGATDRPMFHTPDRHAFPDALYGGILHWDAHLSAEQVANAHAVTSYFYPAGGSREVRELQCGAHPSQEWQQGFRGRHVGPAPSRHFVKNSQGMYEPEQSPPRAYQVEDFAVPFLPRMLESGEDMLFCPEGSSRPQLVPPGAYSVAQERWQLCEPGFYCTRGVRHACPAGTFGDEAGQVTARCSGPCPAGHACPEGSVAPAECPENHYAPAGSAVCVACGTAKALCKTSRKCCEYEQLEA